MDAPLGRRDAILGIGRLAFAAAGAGLISPLVRARGWAGQPADSETARADPFGATPTIRLRPLYTSANASKWGHENVIVELRPPPSTTPVSRIKNLAIEIVDASNRPVRGVRCKLERRASGTGAAYRTIATAQSDKNGLAWFGTISFAPNRLWDLRFSVGGVIVARQVQS